MVSQLFIFLFILFPVISFAQFFSGGNGQSFLEAFSGEDIGSPDLPGDYSFHPGDQSFSVEGGGYNIWFDRDAFYFLSREVKGDFIFLASPEFIGKGVEPHRKMGLMIRNAKTGNAVYMDAAIHGDGLTSLQYRSQKGKTTHEKISDVKSPDFVQLERKGNNFIFRLSKNGEPLTEVGKVSLGMENSVWVGMFVCSHNEKVLEKARFSNVRLVKPAAEGVNGYETPSPSRLEVLDIESGIRKVIYETDSHIEAPNWSRDGTFLIYNSGGRLYHFDLEEKIPEPINTGSVVSNNNDHGISFDGKTLAISSSTFDKGENHSIIYTVPVAGGIPQRVTPQGPSYWHGWSPDDQWLTYCARRNGNYDVYKIPARGGEEVRLTSAHGLDDGPEYSPDGRYIYFNSERSGSMDIWRMHPDGSEKEQVTNDRFQNWFAHPSPDGKWLIMISYLPEVPSSSHPHNKRVMLRLMPTGGGEIKNIAFLYGGQGTLNVPSWSPDSKKVAFVSYTY